MKCSYCVTEVVLTTSNMNDLCERCELFHCNECLHVMGEPRDYVVACLECMTNQEKWDWVEGYADTHPTPPGVVNKDIMRKEPNSG